MAVVKTGGGQLCNHQVALITSLLFNAVTLTERNRQFTTIYMNKLIYFTFKSKDADQPGGR